MRTLVHLSDLHFGRINQALIAPLTDAVHEIAPNVVVVSGDLTQRARSEQFIAARAFLDTLPFPQIVVPGNHDIPLHNLFSRFMHPLKKYQQYISRDLEPEYVDEEIAVLGINTARSMTIKDGRINEGQIGAIRDHLCALDQHIVKIIVTHHPFDLPAHYGEQHLVGRAKNAMGTLAKCGADLLLAGHLHASHAGDTSVRYQIENYSALVVQAGTATSTRGRGEANSFNVLRIESSHIVVERFCWMPDTGAFILATSESFERISNCWHKADTHPQQI
jgi:3',5'-cyclic AMP phosphodiesterase CpdA